MPRVLLIDDDVQALRLRQLILECESHEVFTATDPAEARRLFAETHPDIVVMDLRLPNPADGLALIRAFRALSPTVRLIVLAGRPLDLEGTPESHLVNAVLAKPARSAQLLSSLL